MPSPSGNDFRQARKCQTLQETTFAKRGNVKPFGKRLSPSAEMPNHSGNDFRHARKCQTTRETTFAVRGNAKPFGKRLSPCAEMPNLRFLYFNTTDNDIFKRTLNNRPTLHLVCNVGRKNLRVFMLKLYDVQLDFFILSLYPVLHFKSFNTTKVLHILCCYRKLNFL